MSALPYTSLGTHLRERFGRRVWKITLDAGMTCPNRDGTVGTGGCTYCNDSGSGTGAWEKDLTITEQIAEAMTFLTRRYGAEKFIAYFQAHTNTYAPVERLRELFEEAIADPEIIGLAVGTRPDCVPNEVLELLVELNERVWVSVEYGLQSIHDRTLELVNRGHDVAIFRDAVARTRERGIDVTAHIILGLPGETKDDMLATARALDGMDIQGVKIHLLYVIRDTPLHAIHERGEYTCLTREEYTDIVCDFIALLPPEMIIHRLTGDPHKDELIAPLWSLEKTANLGAINDVLNARGIHQGVHYTPGD